MRLVLLGPPGAGKGTQATFIVDEFNTTHISTGDIFRANIKNETELGKEVKAYLDRGQLVPDELTIQIVMNRLDEEDCKDGFLLDGFPRTIAQAEALEEGLKDRGLALNCVINIAVDKDVLVKRLAGRRVCSNCGAPYHTEINPPKEEGVCDVCGGEVVQRADDNEKTVLDRITVYENQTKPLIDFYEDRDLLVSVDGAQSVDEVSEDIRSALSK